MPSCLANSSEKVGYTMRYCTLHADAGGSVDTEKRGQRKKNGGKTVIRNTHNHAHLVDFLDRRLCSYNVSLRFFWRAVAAAASNKPPFADENDPFRLISLRRRPISQSSTCVRACDRVITSNHPG